MSSKATQSGVAAELLCLLETVTADGRITDDEVTQLKTWLADNSGSNLPGIEFLRVTVEQILADGVVTPEEKLALYKAVEVVLPPEARRAAKERRAAVENLQRTAAKAERDAARSRAAEERARNRPIASANFMVAGVLHDNREWIVEQFVRENDVIFLVRDPGNVHDRNTVEVRLGNGFQIGFVPREDAEGLAPHLDAGAKYRAYVTKVLVGRRAPIPVVQATLYPPGSQVQAAVSQSDAPRRIAFSVPTSRAHERPSKRPASSGCTGVLLLLAAALSTAAAACAVLLR